MQLKTFATNSLNFFLKPIFSVKPDQNKYLSNNSIIIFWPKSSLGLLLSAKQFFSQLKTIYPNSKITLVLRDFTKKKVSDSFLKTLLQFDSTDNITNYKSMSHIGNEYNLAIAPTLKEFSFLSHWQMRFVKTNMRVGADSIDNIKNPFSFIIDKKLKLSWNKNPDIHISEFMRHYLAFLKDYSENFELNKAKSIDKNIHDEISIKKLKYILINNEPEDPQHRLSIEKLIMLISKLISSGDYFFYYIENEMEPEVKKILEKDVSILQFINKNDILAVNEALSDTDLIISCNSDIMHLAGLSNVPQISLFGNANPFVLAPIGVNKKFIKKKSALLDDISSDEVFQLVEKILILENNNEE